ncbi:MAG TPA: nitrilase-related carbon-nitrogen hydrolase, partial [bacterium]|nr:nitrilase-related carbon-nitrogen hydrolase [bacterium]
MKIGYVQFKPQFGDIDYNAAKIYALLEKKQADLMVLPELATTGYYFRDRKEAYALSEDPKKSFVVEVLVELCKKNGMHVITGFNERNGRKNYNSALLIGKKGIVDVYRKIHLFNTEKNCFTPGDKPLRVHKIGTARVGMMICFDWFFPEAMRTLALRGAQLILHPSNLVLPHCPEGLRIRCLENRVFAASADRVGTEEGGEGPLTFIGRSEIVSPLGVSPRLGTLRSDFLGTLSPDPAKGARCPLGKPPRQDCILNLRIRTVRAKLELVGGVNGESLRRAINTGRNQHSP